MALASIAILYFAWELDQVILSISRYETSLPLKPFQFNEYYFKVLNPLSTLLVVTMQVMTSTQLKYSENFILILESIF